MQEPITISSGQSYEKEKFVAYLRVGAGLVCPNTRKPLSDSDRNPVELNVNAQMKTSIEDQLTDLEARTNAWQKDFDLLEEEINEYNLTVSSVAAIVPRV